MVLEINREIKQEDFKGCCSTGGEKPAKLSDIRARRCQLFSAEKARQRSLISRIEKITVEHKGPPEDCTLHMNKDVSTPYNVAMHISELLMTRSVMAIVNGVPWDLHKPLEEDCELQFQHFKDENPHVVNQAFWRSCSFMLGYVLETAFKDQYNIELCSFPAPYMDSGSFVYDVDLNMKDWKPKKTELNILSRLGNRLAYEDNKFDRLEVEEEVAQNIFKYDRFKSSQIPGIASQSKDGDTVTLYRMGDHVDITKGPLIANSNLLYRFMVTALHPIESETWGELTRVQGVAMPKQLPVHHSTFEYLAEKAKKLNKAPLPKYHSSQEQQEKLTAESASAVSS